MLREIKPLAGAGDIVAGDAAEPRRRVAVQVLRVASDYDDLTARDGNDAERRDRDAALGAGLRVRREGARRARDGSSRPRDVEIDDAKRSPELGLRQGSRRRVRGW